MSMKLVIDQETVSSIELVIGKLRIPLSREQTVEMLFGDDYEIVPASMSHRKRIASGKPAAKLLPAPKGAAPKTRRSGSEFTQLVTAAHAKCVTKLGRNPTAAELRDAIGSDTTVNAARLAANRRNLTLSSEYEARGGQPKRKRAPRSAPSPASTREPSPLRKAVAKTYEKLEAKLSRPPTAVELWEKVDQDIGKSMGNVRFCAEQTLKLPLTPASAAAITNGAAHA